MSRLAAASTRRRRRTAKSDTLFSRRRHGGVGGEPLGRQLHCRPSGGEKEWQYNCHPNEAYNCHPNEA
jgi:hypothetical protein